MNKHVDRITHIDGKYIPEYTNDNINCYNYFGWGADMYDKNILIYEYVLRYDEPPTEEKYELTFTLSKTELIQLLDIIKSNLTKFILYEYDVKCVLHNVCDLNTYGNFIFEYHILYNNIFVDITHKTNKATNISIHNLKYLYDVLLKIKENL